MNKDKKERLIELADLFDKIPLEKQEGILIGISMLAAVYNPSTKKAS